MTEMKHTCNNDCFNFSRMTLKGDVMKKLVKKSLAAITTLSLMTVGVMLAGCSGSGGGQSSQVVSGTAAVGEPLSGKVSLKDSSSPSVPKIVDISGDGSFAFDVTGMKAPFILQADGSASGKTYRLHSFAEGPGTANINPLSDALVDSASEDGDSDKEYKNPDSAKLERIKDKMQTAVSDLLEKLRPLLKKFAADGKHPIKDEYKADHHGLDDMFDHVDITIIDGVLTITNKATGAVIFSGSIMDIKHGHFTDNDNDLPLPTVTLVAPTNVATLGGTGQVTLSWNAVSNATSYNVYYSATSSVTTTTGTKITNATTSYVHSGLTANSTLYYIVTAVNSSGEGTASAQIAATTASDVPVLTAPVAPSGVTATGGVNQVSISWPAVADATSYNVYWSTTSGVTTGGTKIVGATSAYIKSGLSDGTTYYFVVTAANSAGESAVSAEVSAATNAAPPATSCTTCHAIPPAIGQHSMHSFTSCGTCHGAGYSSTTVNAATHKNGVKNLDSSTGWNATARSCANSCHGTRS